MKSRQVGQCLVCNDAAVGINFGVPTCMPCKAFFRRNAVKLGRIDFICQEDGDCPVTYESRRICNCCRLAKCFRVMLIIIFIEYTSMKSRQVGQCLVCNDAAVGINFGVLTCMPCKAFFRRNAVKLGTIDFICQEDGDCPVAYESRRICNCCRLAKCFRVGMQKSLILSEAQRLARKELVQQNRQKRAQLMIQNLSLVRTTYLYIKTYRKNI
ncbi:unnamed protein product [Rotaria sp. Silwood2]|nr:unnamed protein product [Rotaria sp. Silwood2]